MRKNILFVETGYGFGGAVTCLSALLRQLDKKKYNPALVFSQTDSATKNFLVSKDWKTIHLARYRGGKKLKQLVENSSKYGCILKKTLVSISFLIKKLYSIPFFIRLYKAAKSHKADLIHINNCFNANIEALLVALFLNIPCIAHVRGGVYNSFEARFIARRIAHFIAVSGYIRDELIRFGIPAGKITVVYDGLDFEAVELKKTEAGKLKAFNGAFKRCNVGIFSCLVGWKGHEIFIKAVDCLIKEKKIRDCSFFIVGSADSANQGLDEKLRVQVQELGLGDYIVFTGYQSNVYPFVQKMDIIVHTSTMPEPLGMVIIEAMALGKPVIASAIGGPIEIIKDGLDGFLVSPSDPRALAEKIYELLRNKETLREISKNAKLKARGQFSLDFHAEQIENIYGQGITKYREPKLCTS